MTTSCVVCKQNSMLTIRNINYCKDCFSTKFYTKVRKELNKFEGKNILFEMEKTMNDVILLQITSKYFVYKQNVELYVLTEANCFLDFFAGYEKIGIFKNNNEVNQLYKLINYKSNTKQKLECVEQIYESIDDIFNLCNIDTLLSAESQYSLCFSALSHMYNGNGQIVKDYVQCKNKFNNVFRPLEQCTVKEIQIYFDYLIASKELNNLEEIKLLQFQSADKKDLTGANAKKMERIAKITSEFLTDQEDLNYSSLYNFIETIKKL